MKKNNISNIFIFIGFAYLAFRTYLQIQNATPMSWLVYAIELITVLELCFIYFAVTHQKKRNKKQREMITDAVAIIDARNCSQDELIASLYSIEESSEFDRALVLRNAVTNEVAFENIADYKKAILTEKIEITSNPKFIAWMNAGDVILEDTISQASAYFTDSIAVVFPKSALWSNEISNGSSPENSDIINDEVNAFISSTSSQEWAGESCIFTSEFFSENITSNVQNANFFATINKALNVAKAKSVYIDVIGFEQQDNNAFSRIETRTNEIRVGTKSLFRDGFKKSSIANLRYATRPLRALRTIAFFVVAGISVLTGKIPFPNSNIAIMFGACAFYVCALLAIKFLSNKRLDQISRIRTSLANLGSDLTSWLKKNTAIAKRINTFAGAALAIYLASCLVARWFLNFGNDVKSQNSAPALLFGIISLGYLVYGLELVGFKQRRNTLRRILNINAKFGRRAIEIADLSPSDCGVISSRPTEIGHEEVISLSIPQGNTTKEIHLQSRVVNSTKVGVNYRIGFVFESMSDEDKAILTKFCTLTYPLYVLRGHSRIAGDSSATDVSLATQKKTTSSITFLRNQSQKPLVRIAAIVALFAVAASNLPPYSRASAATTTGTANTISGVIFQDFNTNGVKDPGTTGSATDAPIAGVTVKATCDNSGVTTTGSATSNDKGEFIISNVTGQCRVETTSGIPTGMKSSQAGTDSNTLVQFHRSGTANVMFGLQYPGDYCQNNPNVLVTCFGRGNITVTYPNKGSIESNTWNSTSDWTDTVKFGKVGTVYGLAYKKDTKELFSSAYLRRKAGFGPMGIGGIYKTSLGTAGNPVTNWLNLETVAQKYGETLGANPRPANQTQYDLAVNDYETEPYVGRRGIGDIDISPDGKTLYATNLNTGSIYAIEIANPQNTQRLSITGTLNTSAGRTCSRTANANDFRIFGLGVKSNGDVFVGGVCTAQSTQNPNDLYYYVFKFDPSNNYSQKLVSTHDLKYDRSKAPNPWQSRVAGTPYPDSSKRNTTVTRWEPWQDRQQTRFVNDETYLYPYPQVSDITFDGNDLIVGMRDIYADTTPPNGVPQPGQPFFWGAAQGDLVRLCGSTTSDQYVLESNRSCPDGRKATGATPNYDESFNGELSFDTNHHMTNGPGGGEWFTGEDPWEYYGEGALGAIAKPGGFNTFLATQSDPSNYQFFGNTTSAWAAGTRWFNASAGTSSRGTTVYNPNQSDWTFSKAGGLGDLEVLCDEAPLQIGNRVWLDENGNGIQDPAENGIGGIGVELVDANNTVVKSTTTNASGEYLFSNVAKNTPYTVRVIASSVAGAVPTTANAGSNDSIDSDGVLGANDYISTSVVGHVAGDNDHTYDFGFKPVYALGNQVFDDVNNNGLKDANEVGIAGVAVTLLKSDGTATGKTTTTNANGNYYFANLDPGSYIVQIVAPAGYISSTGINAKASGPYEPAPSPDTSANLKVDNDDNGTTKNNVIVSLPVTLGKGKQPVGELEGDKINTPDNQNDYTVDFGLFKPSSLGDRVWNDTNKDGIQTTGETGVSGVNVTLYINACGVGGTAIATTTTDANGIYSFGNLAPGNYYVAFQLPNGSVFTQALAGSDRTLDSNANTSTGCSEQITLPVGTTNNTIDAGIKPAIVPIDLTLKKAITNKPPSGSTYKPGDVVNYELTVGNIGDGVAQVGFKVSDVLPSGLTYQGGATASGYSCSVTGQKLECISDHTLAKGVTEKITYHAVIANTFSTSTNSLQNVATITPSVNDVVEDNPLTNCDATGGSVGGKTCNNVDNQSFGLPIDLRVVKSIDTSKNPSYKPGTNVEYLLTVTNNGPATAKSGFKVEDALPSELNFISATGTGYTCNASGQDITCTSDHTLAVGTTDVIRVIAKIKPDLVITGQAIKNIATVKPSTQEPYGETVPVDPCNADGSNKNECNNRDPEVFNVP
ncbi:MAG: SdrD B-like domain-containing protein, partial [Acidimicrobiia bacterium]